MENALDKALANASLNARMNGDTLHTENLDSIADHTSGELPDLPNLGTGEIHSVYRKDGVSYAELPESIPRPVSSYQQMMEAEYAEKLASSNQSNLTLNSIDYKLGEITNAVMHLNTKVDNISTTIASAASMSQKSNFKHRSLHEWDDSQLLNELVERENDLMPFYFELLKRIPRELQPHVDESMKGKYQSLGVLSKLCAALSYVQQPQPTQTQQMSDIIQQLNQPNAEDLARANRNPDKYGSPTYPQLDSQPTILNEYRVIPNIPLFNNIINPYPQG